MRPPRFRIRTLMVAVAVISALLGTKAGIERRRRGLMEHYDRIAEDFAQWLRDRRDFGCKAEAEIVPAPERERRPIEDAEKRKLAQKHIDHFLSLKSKYEYALPHPWLPVSPDLPPSQ